MMHDQNVSNSGIPSFLTPEKVLQIYEKIMQSSVFKIEQAFQALKLQGSCSSPCLLIPIQARTLI